MAFIGESAFPAINRGTGLIPTAPAPVQPPQSTPAGDVASSGAPAEASAPSGGTSDTASSGLAGSGNVSAYSWLLAWGVLLAVTTLINKTRIGHAAIYYALLLTLFFVVLSNYRFIQTALIPFASIGATSQGPSSQGGVNP
jgi:hypothetical protein